MDYGEIMSFRNLPDAERLPAFGIRQSGNELHKKREKCNTGLFLAFESQFVPSQRGTLLKNRWFVAQHKVGKHERALVVEVIAVDEQIEPIDQPDISGIIQIGDSFLRCNGV